MLKITGTLIAKSLIVEGENKFGKWQALQFIIQKQSNGIKKKIVFVCFGTIDVKVIDIPIKKRITIYFEPDCVYNELRKRWVTKLKAKDVEIYIKKPKFDWNTFTEITPDQPKDNQLFT